jgi:hypothetical protein
MLEHSGHKEKDLPNLGLANSQKRKRKDLTWVTSFLLDSCHQLHLRGGLHEHLQQLWLL